MMKEKIIDKIFKICISLLMFYFAYLILILNTIPHRGVDIKLENPFMYYSLGIVFVFFGFLIFKINFLRDDKIIQCSKCPECKEVFNFSELENGKCKYCNDVDTIDIKEYYDKYPEERVDV